MARRHTAVAVSVAIVLAATVLFVTAVRPRPTLSIVEASQDPLPAYMFEPVEVAKIKLDPLPVGSVSTPTPEATPKATEKPVAKVKAILKPTAKPTAKPRPHVASAQPRPRTSHTATGKASWYCKAGVSICHFAYPPGSMVAAACTDLRAAMGSDWRGESVTVTANTGVTVTVKLVDWCASTDKLIDLYWAPMAALGGTGVLRVEVGW